MARDGGLRSRLLGGDQAASEQMVEALEARLEVTERVVHRLTSSGSLVHEYGDETTERGSGEGGTLLAVTDRKLVIVIDTDSGARTADIPYTDLKTVEERGRLLRIGIAIRVWGRGTITLRSGDASGVEGVVSFVSDASDAWQRAVASLQDARGHIADVSEHVEAGGMDAAAEAREAARDEIATARARAAAAPEPVRRAVEERVVSVERELARTRTETSLERAGALRQEGADLTGASQFDAAYAAYERARSRLETALSLATDEGFVVAEDIRAEQDALEEALDRLRARPLERAETALARAHDAETPDAAVTAWEHVLVCYREALTAGWASGAGFAGETDSLRMQTEWLAGRAIENRRRLADRYESEGDTFQMLGTRDIALDRYETACAHLLAARRHAREFRAGNPEELRNRVVRIMGKPAAFQTGSPLPGAGVPENMSGLTATLHTSEGDIGIRLFEERAPNTVENFVGLSTGERTWQDPETGEQVDEPLYDDVPFHRVIEGFMIQTGDPTGTGRGGPGYTFDDEFHPELRHDSAGTVSMANHGPDTNGSQFFITLGAQPHLDDKHAVFGEVVEGMDVVEAIGSVGTDSDDRPTSPVTLESVEIDGQ